MKKWFILAFIPFFCASFAGGGAGASENGPGLLEFKETGFILEIRPAEPVFSFVESAQGVRIRLDGFPAGGEPGAPELPSWGTLVGLGRSSRPTVKILRAEFEEMEDLDVVPVPTVANDSGDPVYRRDAGHYERRG